MKRAYLLLVLLALLLSCVTNSVGTQFDFGKEIDKYSHKKILFSTNFADNESLKLKFRENQKIEAKRDHAVVYGTSQIGGGSLIYLPFSLKSNNRVIIEFEDMDDYEFGFSVMERLENQDSAQSYMIKQVEGNLLADNWPWKKINNNWETKGSELQWNTLEFRYEVGKRYLVIIEIDENRGSSVEIINAKGKRNRFISPYKFEDVPLDLLIRSFNGQAKYYKLIVEEI